MARPRPPAFQFYPRDFLADLRVQAMSWEARGVYWHLCCLYWVERGLPDDADYLARALNMPRRRWNKLWSEIAPCFTRRDKGLKHKRLDVERAKQAAWAAKCSAGGKLGMARRWATSPKADDKGSNDLVITVDNSAFASADQEQEQKKRTAASPPSPPVDTCGQPVENPAEDGGFVPHHRGLEGPPNLRVLLKLAHTFHEEHFESDAAFEDALKGAAAQHHLAYDGPSIRRVAQMVRHSRRPVMVSAPGDHDIRRGRRERAARRFP
jgi:uncharacterized protein YdaU (DUF1376 family)